MQTKARMTFRFDPPADPTPPLTPPPLSKSQSEASESSWTEDAVDLERMIRSAESGEVWQPEKTDAVKAPEHPLFEMSGPEILPSLPAPVREGPSWWRVFASVGGAVVTGALFGYLVLTLFTGETPFPGGPLPSQAASSVSPAVPAEGSAGVVPQNSSTAAPIGNAMAELAGSTFYFLQYGVFASEEGMNAALAELKSKGLPGTPDRSEGYRVYAGAAASREEAELLAGQLSGLEIFVKTVEENPLGTSAAAVNGQTAELIRLSRQLARELSSLSIQALQDEMPQLLDEERLASLRLLYRRWQEQAAIAVWSGTAKEPGKVWADALMAGMASVEDYQAKVSRYHLWRVQSDVMQAVIAERAALPIALMP
jgi:hypothetical protein